MGKVKIKEALARQIYQILIDDCEADPKMLETFVQVQLDEQPTEWRIFGKLGNGGKFCNSEGGVLYVTCYPADQRAGIKKLIEQVNAKLLALITPKTPITVTCYYIAHKLEDNYGNVEYGIDSQIFFTVDEAQHLLESRKERDEYPNTYYDRYYVASAYINEESLNRFIEEKQKK